MNPAPVFPFMLAAIVAVSALRAAEPALKPHDVVAFIGGEEMVATTEAGHLETRLIRAFPDHELKFRGLAWEGDTVFQQLRDLNYPTLEQQLDDCGATVIIAQFGQMESLAGPGKLAEFKTAYIQLITRLQGGRKRRLILLAPTPPAAATLGALTASAVADYTAAIRGLAAQREGASWAGESAPRFAAEDYRDGMHLNDRGQVKAAAHLAAQLGGNTGEAGDQDRRLIRLVQAKNTLWFNYNRPQNWAFLHGDRTVQPSSRDHLDPEKRWFPDEMKLWLPLLAAKEQEIQTLSGQGKTRAR